MRMTLESGEMCEFWKRRGFFSSTEQLEDRALCQHRCGVTARAGGTECRGGPQKGFKKPSCCCVFGGHATKLVLSLFHYRIIPLNFGLLFLLINFGDLPQFQWIKGECLSMVHEFLRLSDKRSTAVRWGIKILISLLKLDHFRDY